MYSRGDETKPSHYETRNCYPVQSETLLRDLKNRLLALKQGKISKIFNNIKTE